jgi:hypothetical protein
MLIFIDMEYNIGLTEKEYFNLTEEERMDIANKVITIMKSEKLLFIENDFENIIIPVLEIELKKGLIVENYMMCDSIKRMLKILKNEKTL